MESKKYFCINCGKKAKISRYPTYLCKKCNVKREKEIKQEEKIEKQRIREINNKIKHEFKINNKIREIEKILKKPCMVEVNVANEGIFLFGRFVNRKFKVSPLTKNKRLAKLKGDYKDIDDFCRKAKRIGYKTEKWSGVEVSLEHKGRRYNFLSDGIYKDVGRAGPFHRMSSGKVANVEYELLKGTNSKKQPNTKIPDLGPIG
jgi:DNA-directed RNA polymerase subunit RPC12/RpoP